jgi:hypothetical protein
MDIHPSTLARARMALNLAVQRHLFDRNVSLIDFGFPEHNGQLHPDELAIRIHVLKKMSGAELESAVSRGVTHPIPESYGEFQTDVPQSAFRLHQAWAGYRWNGAANPRTSRQNPLQGGFSISNQYQYSAGTLGGLVVDRATRTPMLLSNWHVLAGRWMARPGQGIYQPGLLDGGGPADAIASLSRNAMNNNLDAAVAVLNDGRTLTNDIYQLGHLNGVRQAQLGMQVVKSGRTTGVTYGMVSAVEGIARLMYDSLDRVIKHVQTIEPQNVYDQVSGPGDSGSFWLDQDNRQAVGLHFAGSDYPERALAMDMQLVLDALQVDVLGASEQAPAYEMVQQMEPVTA